MGLDSFDEAELFAAVHRSGARAVLIGRRAVAALGIPVVWHRHQSLPYEGTVRLALPTIDDLILTKRFAARRKDLIDIESLERLKKQGTP